MSDRLENGATVLLRHKIDGTEKSIVLALYHSEYVTWRVSEDGFVYSGNYFQDDQLAAAKDYTSRVEAAIRWERSRA